ncbi:hypothetical protein Ddye_006494 [Dipteronia dyeriana]|uniref:Uncharacterized protein n=1 Tax=Dipteronia dyeriana TaxID=168575 RepID=A0AAD9XIR2_9ROSI|nr:hypothetical protein Ddye_006494 [Dipteronia dyeriana]
MDNNNVFGLGFSLSTTRDCLNFKVPKSNYYMMRPAEKADRRSLVNIDNQPEESSANKLAAKAMKREPKEADNSTKQQDVGSSIRNF